MGTVVGMSKVSEAFKAIVESNPLFGKIEEHFSTGVYGEFVMYFDTEMVDEVSDYMEYVHLQDDYDIQGVIKDGKLMSRLRIW